MSDVPHYRRTVGVKVDEQFSDAERRRLLSLCIEAVPRDHGDAELTAIIAKLSGVDTVLVARRAYKASRTYEDWFHGR
jgi:hypothetical protein